MVSTSSVHGVIARVFNAATLSLLLLAGLLYPVESRADGVRLLALGDSLTAGYGLAEAESFTVQLEAALLSEGYDVQVINGGVSGDTTAGGLARLEWALSDDPDLVLVELGANDGLRGLDPATTRENLARILATLKERGIPVLLAGMYAPPNLGKDYGERFNAVFPELAKEYDVQFYPFFLDGVAMVKDLNQDDGIHPNGQGVAAIVERLVPHVIQLIDDSGLRNAAVR